MTTTRPFEDILGRLRAAGLRPTRQRLALGRLLFDGTDRHVTAEDLHRAAEADEADVSLATVYNTLHQFTRAGLLREVVLGPGRSYFDTNVDEHHHVYYEDDGRLEDIPADAIDFNKLPAAPRGHRISRVDVVLRVTAREEGER